MTGEELVSASPLEGNGGRSRALSIDEIKELERDFAAAARRVKEAGYDGVEIHSAHGYLLNQFYSPLTNFRDDDYGPQSLENRLRFLTEITAAVRQVVGNDFPIAVRLGGSDYQDGGSTIDDAAGAAQILEASGIDLLDLSGGLGMFMRPGHREPGWFFRHVKSRKSTGEPAHHLDRRCPDTGSGWRIIESRYGRSHRRWSSYAAQSGMGLGIIKEEIYHAFSWTDYQTADRCGQFIH